MLLETVSLKDIDISSSPTVRYEIHPEAVEEYARLYREKKPMPKAVLFKVGTGHYLVADGTHRIAAMRLAGLTERGFDVVQGSYEDCLLYAAAANQGHGVRRSNADKRTAVESLLKTFPRKSDRDISEISGVGYTLVASVRKSMEKTATIKESPKRIGSDGKVRKVNCPRGQLVNVKSENIGDSEIRTGPTKTGKMEAVLDEMGLEVPGGALVFWNRRQEVQDLMTAISRVKTSIANSLKERDPLYVEVSNTIIADLDRVYGSLSVAKPYTVCPSCQGRLAEKCTTCSRRGLISKFYWDVMIDAETKKMRSRIASKKL
jgi:hypothetical protein